MVRTALLSALSGWIAWGAPPQAAWAQGASHPHPSLEVAELFAPILWLAADEPLYPTLPHPLAFDGQDNDGNGLVDLEDVGEVRFGFRPGCPVEKMAEQFRQLRKRPPRRVLYEGPTEFEPKKREQPSDVIAFWFYYLFDQGVNAHVNDAEHAFVFLDVRHEEVPVGHAARYDLRLDEDGLSRAVRAVVGAGHETHTANNILVAGREIESDKILPLALPPHMPILVELGKHASAPDRNLDGRFDLGMDANIFRGSAWGSRDMQTANLGQVDVGPFQSWFSFPRSPQKLYVEQSFHDRCDQGRSSVRTEQTRCRRDSYAAYADQLRQLPRENDYRLFPVDDMKALYDLLEERTAREEKRRRVTAFLEQHKVCFWGERRPVTVKISEDVLSLMEQWPRRTDAKREVWKHKDYENKADVFKLHLYPRLALGGGGVVQTQLKRGWQGALQVADIRAPAWIPFFGGQRFLNESTLELSLGQRERMSGVSDVTLSYKMYRGGYWGPFIGTSWSRERLPGADDLAPSQLTKIAIDTGRLVDDQIVEVISDRGPVDHMFWGVDAGLAFTLPYPRRLLGVPLIVELKAGWRFEPFKDDLNDIDRAFGARERTRAFVSVNLFLGLISPKHPLTY